MDGPRLRLRRVLPAVAGAVALCLAPQAADAQVQFTGSTLGCFGMGCTPGAADAVQGFSFSAGTFDVVNVVGFTTGIGGMDNFGTYALASDIHAYNEQFTLEINFTNPTVQQAMFSAMVTGSIISTGGGVTINWSSPTTFSWSDATYTYTVGIYDVGVNRGQTGVPQTGFVRAQVPEPMAMLLVGSGLLGLAGVARRRKNNGDVQNI